MATGHNAPESAATRGTGFAGNQVRQSGPFADSLETSAMSLLAIDIETRTVSAVTRGSCLLVQRSRDDLLGASFAVLDPRPDPLDMLLSSLRRELPSPLPVKSSFTIALAVGGRLACVAEIDLVDHADSRFALLHLAVQPHQNVAARVLARQPSWLDEAIAQIGATAWRWNLQTNAIEFESGAEIERGMPRGATFSGLDFSALIVPEDIEHLMNARSRTIETRGPFAVDCRLALPGEDARWFAMRGDVVNLTANGDPLLIEGVSYPIAAPVLQSPANDTGGNAQGLDRSVVNRHIQTLALLDRARKILARELDLSAIAEEMTTSITQALPQTSVSMYVVCEDEPVLLHRSPFERNGAPVPSGLTIVTRALAERIPVFEPGGATLVTAREAGGAWQFAIPLFRREQVAGVLLIESRSGSAQLTRTAQNALIAIGKQLDAALERALLFEEARAGNEHAQLCMEAANMATWDWDVKRNTVTRSGHMAELFGVAAPEDQHQADYYVGPVHPDDQHLITEADLQIRQRTSDEDPGGFRDYFCEFRVIHRNGETRWLQARGRLHRDEAGGPDHVLGVTQDVTNLKRTQLALAAERDLLTTVIDLLPFMVFAKDQLGRFVRLNLATAYHLGLSSPEAAIGKTDFDFFPPAIAWRYRNEELAVMESGKGSYDELESFPGRDGTLRWWITNTAPVRDANGHVVGIVGSAQDVTARIEMEQDLREARDAAEAASRAKIEFLSTMNHELRTPMNAIIGYAHLLLDGYDGPLLARQQEDLTRITIAADHLLVLINNLLDFSRMQSNGLELWTEPVRLASLIEQIAGEFSARASAKKLALVIDLPSDLPDLLADPARLRQILIDLLDNAIKFTSVGAVSIRATAAADCVHIAIADTGPGIAPEFLGGLFDEFRQADGSPSRRHGGAGLGLAITRRLVHLHGGEIDVVSTVGKGSVFTLRMPMVPSASR